MTNETVFVVLFFAIFSAVTATEMVWLHRVRGVGRGRAMLFVFASNFITVTAGLFVSLYIFASLFAGSSARPAPTVMAAVFAAVLFAVVVLTRLALMRLLGLRRDGAPGPLAYSAAAGTAFLAAAVGVPAAFLYFS